jgi:hypothetical protein
VRSGTLFALKRGRKFSNGDLRKEELLSLKRKKQRNFYLAAAGDRAFCNVWLSKMRNCIMKLLSGDICQDHTYGGGMGQLTFHKDLLNHLRIKPDDKIELAGKPR